MINEHLANDACVELTHSFGDKAVEICRHVADCTHCQDEIAEVQSLTSALREGEEPSSAMMQKASLAISEIATSSEQRPSRVLDLLVFLAAGVTIWLAVSSAIGANVLHPSGFAILVAGISGCIAAIYARLQVA